MNIKGVIFGNDLTAFFWTGSLKENLIILFWWFIFPALSWPYFYSPSPKTPDFSPGMKAKGELLRSSNTKVLERSRVWFSFAKASEKFLRSFSEAELRSNEPPRSSFKETLPFMVGRFIL